MDPVSRSAAKLAALVAVPIAVLAGIGAFAVLRDAPPSVPTEPVPMTAPALTEEQEVACRALLARLPTELDGLAQREVSAGPEQNAAYGEPPITLACGAPEAAYELTDRVYRLSGVCWHVVEGPEDSVWTTLDREVPIAVTVPTAYDPPAQQVIEFDQYILGTIAPAPTVPSGCTDDPGGRG